jgi:hypothetical protein
MRDYTKIPPRGEDSEAIEQYLDDLLSAMLDGMEAAKAVAEGGIPNVDVLDEYAHAMEGLRIGVEAKRLSFEWIEPTEEDVRNARALVQLVREGAPAEALIEPARRAARLYTDSWALGVFLSALIFLEDEDARVKHQDRIKQVLDKTIAMFERGCSVAGFVPTASDLANVKRLRELATEDGEEALLERRRLVKEGVARLPHINIEYARDMAPERLYSDD